MKITPAIIPEDYHDLESKLGRLRGLSRTVQIDACDGKLTPKASWPYTHDREGRFEMVLRQEEGLPLWDDFDFEIDMMVRYPEIEYERWIDAGGSRIVVHHYSGQDARTKKVFEEIIKRGSEPIICFEVSASMEEILAFDGKDNDFLKNIQLMGIRHDGLQGEPFARETIERVKRLRERFPESEIAIDGGVNEETAQPLADAGADRLVIGSALFNSGDLEESLDYFESI
jgi:ribulose-phosphate 3-epimerase